LEAENSHAVRRSCVVRFGAVDGMRFVSPIATASDDPPRNRLTFAIAEVQTVRDTHEIRFGADIQPCALFAFVNVKCHAAAPIDTMETYQRGAAL
jgi:hypothetical protein